MTTVALPAELLIAGLESLRAELAAALPGPLVLDAAAVERVDTASLQLLCAVVSAGHSVSWQAPSPSLIKAAAQLGLAAHLGLST